MYTRIWSINFDGNSFLSLEAPAHKVLADEEVREPAVRLQQGGGVTQGAVQAPALCLPVYSQHACACWIVKFVLLNIFIYIFEIVPTTHNMNLLTVYPRQVFNHGRSRHLP